MHSLKVMFVLFFCWNGGGVAKKLNLSHNSGPLVKYTCYYISMLRTQTNLCIGLVIQIISRVAESESQRVRDFWVESESDY